MGEKLKPPPDDPDQSRRFKETAKELGADVSGRLFDAALRAVTSPKRDEAEKKRLKTDK